jgi:single-strand DNA-binding protein
MNHCTLIGRLVKDPELRSTATGKSVCTFTIAINRGFGDKKETDFLPVVVWSRPNYSLAENCAKHLTKGSKVGISGRIQTRSYETQNGERKYVTEIVAEEVEFLTPKAEEGSGTKNQFHEDEKAHGDSDFEPLDDDPNFPF